MTQQIETRLTEIERRLDRGAKRMDGLDSKLGDMTDELRINTGVTTEVRDLLDAFRGGFKVLGWFGVAAKWVGVLAATGLAIYKLFYSITHGGQLPK